MILDDSLMTYTKRNSKWIRDLNETRHYKTPRKKKIKALSDIKCSSNFFLIQLPKNKNLKMGHTQTQKLCTTKETINKTKKTTHKLGENIWKWCDQQKIRFQNFPTASLSCIGEGNGNPLQCSCLENPRVGVAWWAAIYGDAQSQTRLKWLSSSSSMMFNSTRSNNPIKKRDRWPK